MFTHADDFDGTLEFVVEIAESGTLDGGTGPLYVELGRG
jgi:hypothetical protein